MKYHACADVSHIESDRETYAHEGEESVRITA